MDLFRGWFLQRPPPSDEQSVTFKTIWQRSRRTSHGSDAAICATGVEIRQQIAAGTITAGRLAKEVLEFVNNESAIQREQGRLLLLEAVDILATNRVVDRELVRDTLKCLYKQSKLIDREVFLFEHAKLTENLAMDEEARQKRTYILDNIAGWLVCREEFPSNTFNTIGTDYFYIELPFKRAGNPTTSHIMAEALYRLMDEDFVLDLLRHGIRPSCLYLWPIAVMLDLKFALTELTQVPPDELQDIKEARMIRYFCRARSYFYVHFVRGSEARNSQLPPRIAYDDILLLPPNANILVPDDRYKKPASLIHQSRLAIRKSITKADQLPHGIYQLPLPKIMHEYIDLLMD